MAKVIIGSFAFRNEGNGNLTSIFQEHTDNTSFPEAAKRIPNTGNDSDPFEGEYQTIWIEADSKIHSASLKIKRNGEIYDLSWTAIKGLPKFGYQGRGFISEARLIGSYWKL